MGVPFHTWGHMPESEGLVRTCPTHRLHLGNFVIFYINFLINFFLSGHKHGRREMI